MWSWSGSGATPAGEEGNSPDPCTPPVTCTGSHWMETSRSQRTQGPLMLPTPGREQEMGQHGSVAMVRRVPRPPCRLQVSCFQPPSAPRRTLKGRVAAGSLRPAWARVPPHQGVPREGVSAAGAPGPQGGRVAGRGDPGQEGLRSCRGLPAAVRSQGGLRTCLIWGPLNPTKDARGLPGGHTFLGSQTQNPTGPVLPPGPL